jgi:molybdate transport system ATP-binding protein
MQLSLSICKRLKNRDLDISLACRAGQLLAVVGPSGAGKTTILRAIAGLERPDAGWIVFDHTVWFDSGTKVNLAPQKRRVGYVAQGYGLFPHLTVRKNIGFAARSPDQVSRLLNLFGLAGLADHQPDEISGGEQQRAAFAQALAAEPRIMLLDEPFSALDYKTKDRLRDELVRMKKDLHIPIIMVTHDLDEAVALGDAILPVVDGVPAPEWLPDTVPARLLAATGVAGHMVDGSGETMRTDRASLPAKCSPCKG